MRSDCRRRSAARATKKIDWGYSNLTRGDRYRRRWLVKERLPIMRDYIEETSSSEVEAKTNSEHSSSEEETETNSGQFSESSSGEEETGTNSGEELSEEPLEANSDDEQVVDVQAGTWSRRVTISDSEESFGGQEIDITLNDEEGLHMKATQMIDVSHGEVNTR